MDALAANESSQPAIQSRAGIEVWAPCTLVGRRQFGDKASGDQSDWRPCAAGRLRARAGQLHLCGVAPVIMGVLWRHSLALSPMFFRSFFYERTVLSLLEKVQRLPPNVQAEIAARLGKYINLARTAKDEASVAQVATAAGQERDRLSRKEQSPH